MPCKNKLDASTLFLHILRGFYGKRIKIASYLRKATTWIIKLLINRCGVNKQERSNISQAYSLTSFNAWTPCRSESTSLPLQICFHYSRRDRHLPAAYAKQVGCQAQNQSLVSVRVRSVRAASSRYAAKTRSTRGEVATKKINAHNSLCSTRTKHIRIDMALIPLLVFAA